MDHTIELSEAGDDAIRSAIVRPLVAYNVEKTGRTDYRPLAVVIRNSDAEVIGGLWDVQPSVGCMSNSWSCRNRFEGRV